MNKQEIINILAEYKLAPLKSKGQNFLVDSDVSHKIVSFLDPLSSNVIEIGPGLGSLTKYLSAKTTNLTCVEIDKGYAKYLQNTYENINVVESDFLKYVVPRETTCVIGNLPYYITTKLIEKVLLDTPNLATFVFMVERSVETRLLAKTGTKEYGPLAILFNVLGQLEAKLIVSADKFYPIPHVDSLVFRFVRSNNTVDIKGFYPFLKQAFLTRRKTLFNNLVRNYGESDIKAAYTKLNINGSVRAEALLPTTLLTLYHELIKNA